MAAAAGLATTLRQGHRRSTYINNATEWVRHTKHRVAVLSAIAALLTGMSFASAKSPGSDLASMELAQQLADILVSESLCGLSYDKDAIRAFVGKRVQADDIQFNTWLALMMSGTKIQLQDLSASAKTVR